MWPSEDLIAKVKVQEGPWRTEEESKGPGSQADRQVGRQTSRQTRPPREGIAGRPRMEYRTVGTLNSEITVYWTLSFIVNKHRSYPLKCLVGKWGYSVKCLCR